MKTYRKKSLKVHNIFVPERICGLYSHSIARQLKEFIEKGEYARIVDIFIFGESNQSLCCSIIYEQAMKPKGDK